MTDIKEEPLVGKKSGEAESSSGEQHGTPFGGKEKFWPGYGGIPFGMMGGGTFGIPKCYEDWMNKQNTGGNIPPQFGRPPYLFGQEYGLMFQNPIIMGKIFGKFLYVT
jgi:hypothetical protein